MDGNRHVNYAYMMDVSPVTNFFLFIWQLKTHGKVQKLQMTLFTNDIAHCRK